jgi:hypothetical protein
VNLSVFLQVITAFVLVFSYKALVYFIDSNEKALLEPYYTWTTVQLDSWVDSGTPGLAKIRADCVVTCDSNCLYFVYKTYIFQARLILEEDTSFLTMSNQNCFPVNRWEKNKSVFAKVKHFIRPYFEDIFAFKDKVHDQPWKLFILPILNISTLMGSLSNNFFLNKLLVQTRLTSGNFFVSLCGLFSFISACYHAHRYNTVMRDVCR